MTAHYLDRLGEFAYATQLQDLDDRIRNHARWVIADSIPVIAAGMQVPEMKTFSDERLSGAADGDAWVIGRGRRANPLDAALLNGTAGTWLELDEGNLFAKGHPGIQVVPAALAVAQQTGASGTELLLAVTLGYEISARISRAANVRTCVHPHGTYGVMGAAIAVGRLRGFKPAQMRELISMSATMGMATSRNTLLEGSTVRNIYTGHSGLMGQIAAQLTQAGFQGERDGVASVYGGGVLSEEYDTERVMDGLGSEWLTALGYFKLHCTGRYVHSAIDALQDALRRAPTGAIDPQRVRRIDVKAYRLAAMLSGKNIRSSFGARFSVPFAIATILHHGRSDLHAFSEAALADPAVQDLVQRVFVEEDPAYNEHYPDRQLCTLRITMDDGTVLEGECIITKGEPANPHETSELRGKFFELGNAVWGDTTTQKLYDACMALEDIEDFRRFSSTLNL